MLRHDTLCYAAPCCNRLHYVMLCHAKLCHAILEIVADEFSSLPDYIMISKELMYILILHMLPAVLWLCLNNYPIVMLIL